jgi:hypothetical protein
MAAIEKGFGAVSSLSRPGDSEISATDGALINTDKRWKYK